MANSFKRISYQGQRETQPKRSGPKSTRSSCVELHEELLVENVFHTMLLLERRRADRSNKPFVLMLLDANLEKGAAKEILMDAVQIVVTSKRETDLAGWYEQGAVLGIIFTEVSIDGEIPITEILRSKLETSFLEQLGRDRASKIAISMHLFPETWEKADSGWPEDDKVYAELKQKAS